MSPSENVLKAWAPVWRCWTVVEPWREKPHRSWLGGGTVFRKDWGDGMRLQVCSLPEWIVMNKQGVFFPVLSVYCFTLCSPSACVYNMLSSAGLGRSQGGPYSSRCHAVEYSGSRLASGTNRLLSQTTSLRYFITAIQSRRIHLGLSKWLCV